MKTRKLTMPRVRSALLVALAALAAACQPAEPPVVRIGLIGVFTGPLEGSSGVPGRQGAQLAIAEINAAGGVVLNGVAHQLRLVEAETENRPDAAAVAARRLVNLDSVDVIIGPQSSTLAIAAAPIAEESEVLMLVPMASNPQVTAGRRFVFRLAFLDSFQGEVLARFAFDSLGIRRAGVLHDAASPYGRDISALFATTFSNLGGEVVGVERFDTDGSRDYRPQFRRLLARRPQALLLPNFVSADSVQLRQALELGFTGRFLGTDSWDVRGLAANPAFHGALIVGNWDRDTTREMARRFHREWKRSHDTTPFATAAATYDAVHIVAEAMRRSGQRGGPTLADSLQSFGRYEGAVSSFDFRGGNDPVRGAVLLQLGPDGLGIRTSVPPRSP